MDTKSEILLQTSTLTMKYGIKSVSMDDIATSLGISKKTIYQHYTNKKELIKEMVLMMVEKDMNDVLDISKKSKDALDEIINIAKHFLQFLREMSPTMTYDMQKYYAKEWRMVEQHHNSFIYTVIKNNIERGIKEGLYLDDINADVLSKIHVKQSDCITDEDLFPLKNYNKRALYKTLITYHIRGIVSEKGRAIIKKIKID